MRRLPAGLVYLLLTTLARPVAAQVAEPAPTEAIRVFLDCQFECDSQFLRTEINYVIGCPLAGGVGGDGRRGAQADDPLHRTAGVSGRR